MVAKHSVSKRRPKEEEKGRVLLLLLLPLCVGKRGVGEDVNYQISQKREGTRNQHQKGVNLLGPGDHTTILTNRTMSEQC